MGIRLFLTVFSAAAATGGFREPTSRGCRDMCQEIQACAKAIGRDEQTELLCYLARCETGDKCRSNVRSPSGRYSGVFQFARPTWRSVCRPLFRKKKIAGCDSPAAQKDPCCATQCAAEIIATEANGGLGNWPQCGAKAREAASTK